ncbi:MAG: hypothetical protein H6684_07730 [Deltaproteobacteria bacterium]|nr:hypothetical protein [Deltaproteobacteria bacterium]MCB9488603.1 hypothetical protein [Deltaproteobacteria bacterium]
MAKKNPAPLQLHLSVLIYDEDESRVAHCLEMDLKGHGKTDRKALDELAEMVEMQISFALQRGEHGLLYHPADESLFRRFRSLQAAAVQAFPENPKSSWKNAVPRLIPAQASPENFDWVL